jgi:hypothetical protein
LLPGVFAKSNHEPVQQAKNGTNGAAFHMVIKRFVEKMGFGPSTEF